MKTCSFAFSVDKNEKPFAVYFAHSASFFLLCIIWIKIKQKKLKLPVKFSSVKISNFHFEYLIFHLLFIFTVHPYYRSCFDQSKPATSTQWSSNSSYVWSFVWYYRYFLSGLVNVAIVLQNKNNVLGTEEIMDVAW